MTQSRIAIGVAGCAGRMGRELLAATCANNDFCLAGGTVKADSEFKDHDLGRLINGQHLNLNPVTKVEDLIKNTDVLIDFTKPEVSLSNLQACSATNTPMVIGTTGFSESQLSQLEQLAANSPVLYAPNMSIGVNATLKLLQLASELLDSSFDIEIIESHHKNKIDAPSGTALKMGEVIAKQKSKSLEQIADLNRLGNHQMRKLGSIGFSSIRAGNIFGEHTVLFANEDESISISHQAFNRAIFAKGALKAAKWLHNKPNGLYSMQDVLKA